MLMIRQWICVISSAIFALSSFEMVPSCVIAVYSGIRVPFTHWAIATNACFATLFDGSLMAKGNDICMVDAIGFWARKLLLRW